MRLEIRINELPKLQADTMGHCSVRSRYRKRWHKLVADAIFALPNWREFHGREAEDAMPWDRSAITITRHSSGRVPDADNLAYSAKCLLDGLVRATVLVDDSPDHVEVKYLHEKAKPGAGFVTISVEPR